MDEAKFLDLERGFWLEGEPHYRKHMARGCVMVFPKPAGIMSGSAIVESLSSMPRWAELKMTQQTLSAIGEGVMVLAYRADASREGAEPYRALCSSTYVREDGAWRLIQHQHTAV